MVGELLMKCGHHLFEGALVVNHIAGGRKSVAQTHRHQMLFELGHNNVTKGHGGGPDLGTYHLELSGNP